MISSTPPTPPIQTRGNSYGHSSSWRRRVWAALVWSAVCAETVSERDEALVNEDVKGLGTDIVVGDVVTSPGGGSYRLVEQILSCAATYTALPAAEDAAESRALTPSDTTCFLPPADIADGVGSTAAGGWFSAALTRRSPDQDGPSMLKSTVLDERTQQRRLYNLGNLLGKGAQGEVWRATRIGPHGEEEEGGSFVLKRMFATRPGALLSGWREAWFGAALRGQPYAARYVEHFLRENGSAGRRSKEPSELWLVFRDEGVSLQALLYTARRIDTSARADTGSGGGSSAAAALLPSPFWLRLVTEPEGAAVFVSILRQLLHAIRNLNRVGVLHRDVKPANALISFRGGALRLRLADFGSAVGDDDTLAKLYPVSVAMHIHL